MKEKIMKELKKIDDTYRVKVLSACESGSRAWGFPSKDSDYDVRFIYIHERDWYLSIDQKRDVIELPINDLLDINGWELTKALRLYRKSNPPLLEWLHSGIVYYQAFSVIEKMKQLSDKVYKPTACLHHYLNMAKGNYRHYLQNEQVKIKKYFYVLRPVLACKWIQKYNTIPPLEFQSLLEEIVPDGSLKKEIQELLERKKRGDELDFEPRIDSINEFVETEIEHLTQYAKSLDIQLEDPTQSLDQLFRDALYEVWGN
ncbi:nucleotidyltransferase domain-containing protein [Bacillus sp. V59.32b]|uniref:nucleotidyltransferase domain-containing protein n=1 Tax=Bacillus sp. V59.32b TaxID=1758642 RepID=UPI000E3DD7DF|nr:nucleotidyltransferase domain-containing protein [Bacillus sp. V59.32b]RFU68352.1 nucleotidyltransferase domain-containing protein [Bacillus sp. V59.32b]